MLDRDPDFYRKWIAICAQTAVAPLTAKLDGNSISVFHGNKKIATINQVLFAKLSGRELMKLMGVPKRDFRH